MLSLLKRITINGIFPYNCCLILFLALFPISIGNSTASFNPTAKRSQNCKTACGYPNPFVLEINSQYEHSSQPDGLIVPNTGHGFLYAFQPVYYALSGKLHSCYASLFSPKAVFQYGYKAGYLLLDMPPPLNPV